MSADLAVAPGDAWLSPGERQVGCRTLALPWPCSTAGHPRAELAEPVPRPCYPSRLRPARLPAPAPFLPFTHGLLSARARVGSGGAAATSPSPVLPLTLAVQLGLTRGHSPQPCSCRPCQAGTSSFCPLLHPCPAAPQCDHPIAHMSPSLGARPSPSLSLPLDFPPPVFDGLLHSSNWQ